MRIYLAGSITNDPDYRIKFANAATKWRDQGWEVVSPSELNDSIHPFDHDRSRAMRVDIPLLMTCDAIAMLDALGASAMCTLRVGNR